MSDTDIWIRERNPGAPPLPAGQAGRAQALSYALKGHGFSRAIRLPKRNRALAPEGGFSPRRAPRWLRASLAPALLLLALLFPAPARAQQSLRLAAAADLQPLLPPLLARFQRQTGIAVQASYKSSATLATEIVNGAPFNLFMAADMSFPQRVIGAGKAVESHPIPYARGTLVLWTRNDSGLGALSLDGLTGPAVHSIAVANAQHAPYGRAAQAALEHAHLYAALRPKLVIAENIAQAAQYADSANAQVGFISLTSALTPRLRASGHYIVVPAQDYPPLTQGVVVIRGSGQSAAGQFLKFLLSPATGKYLAARGLQPIH